MSQEQETVVEVEAEAPDAPAEVDFLDETADEAFTDAIIAKFMSQPAPKKAEAVEAAESPSEVDDPGPEEPTEVEDQPQESVDPAPDPRAAKIAEAAGKEAELRSREAKLREQEKALEERLAQLEEVQRQAQSKVTSEQELLARFSEDPAGFFKANEEYLKSRGFETPADLASYLYMTELGDDAPAEFREKMEKKALAARLNKLEKQADPQELVKKAVAQARFEAKAEALNDALIEASQSLDSYPLLKKYGELDGNDVYEEMATYAATVIKDHGRWPTAKEVAQGLESYLESITKLGGSPASTPASPEAPTTESKPRKQHQTLSDADTARKSRKKKDLSEMTEDEIEDLMVESVRRHMAQSG